MLDFVDRDMMLYKLLRHNINRKVYNSIKNIYQSSESCVRIDGKLTAPLLAICGDMGWMPFSYRQWTNIAFETTFCYLMMIVSQRLLSITITTVRNNWCGDVKNMLTKLDLLDYYERKDVISMKLFETKLKNYYASIWKTDIPNVPKLRTDVKFKTTFEREPYIKLNLHKHGRSLLAQ